MRIYDISMPLTEGVTVWPGDEAYRFAWSSLKRDGSTVNLGSVTMSVHTGAHADAPFHADDDGATIDVLSLEPFFGPAIVIDVRGLPVIRKVDLPPDQIARAPRLLLKTLAWTDRSQFPTTIPVIAEDVPEYLGAYGVRLLGIDLPSVDTIDSKELPNHHALNASDIRIIESVCLDEVPAGVYDLIALPLKLAGSDGSPVRAILVER